MLCSNDDKIHFLALGIDRFSLIITFSTKIVTSKKEYITKT